MHRRLIVAGAVAAAVAAGLGIVACTDRREPVPAAPSFSNGPGTDPTSCDFSNVTSLVIAYFPGGQRQNTVKDLVTAMDAADDFSATARDRAFDIMTHIDTVVTNGTAGDPATGSNLVNALIYCMYAPTVAAELAHRPETFPEDFTVELDPDLHGAFGVRGGATDPLSAPVLSRPLATAFSGVSTGGDSNWVTTVIGNASPERVLFYGRPVPDSADQYEWKTLPHDATFDPAIVVGFCLDDFAYPTSMVEMRPGGVLAFQGVEFLPAGCSNTALLRSGWQGTLASLARFGAELFGPRPLWATIVSPGGLGGTTGGIGSKFKPRDLQGTGGVTLTFTQEPPGILKVNETFTVQVRATTGTTNVAGVSVKLGAFNNNGTPVVLTAVKNPVVTDAFGLATFTLSLNKTGAYVLRTTSESEVVGRTTITITPAQSRKFNVKPAK